MKQFRWRSKLIAKYLLYLSYPVVISHRVTEVSAEEAAKEEESRLQQLKDTHDKLKLNKFLASLATGIHIRRHEGNHMAETIRLYTNDGGHTIKWAPKVAIDLAKQRHSSHVNEGGTTRVVYASSADSNGFDCCFSGI